jgi:flavin-dependent dehydrogenase
MARRTSDIVVVGGGPAGAVCARQLARLGHDVVLAERTRASRPRVGESCRPAVRRLLEANCDLSIPERHYRTLAAFHSAWGQDTTEGRSLEFWHAENGIAVDRAAFDDWLIESAEDAGVTVLRNCNVTEGQTNGRESVLRAVSDGSELALRARFVIEATGRRMRSLTQPDARRIATDALVCASVELADHSMSADAALIEACDSGWWYAVQDPSGNLVVAMFTDADMVPSAQQRRNWFEAHLTRTAHIKRVALPMSTDVAVAICGARTSVRRVLWRNTYIAIGDAAWCIDPLSGTGIERAIRDGIDAAAAVSQSITGGTLHPMQRHACARANAFQEQRELQRHYYGMEGRWRHEPFWSRRM